MNPSPGRGSGNVKAGDAGVADDSRDGERKTNAAASPAKLVENATAAGKSAKHRNVARTNGLRPVRTLGTEAGQ
jgi:hypothetical protein